MCKKSFGVQSSEQIRYADVLPLYPGTHKILIGLAKKGEVIEKNNTYFKPDDCDQTYSSKYVQRNQFWLVVVQRLKSIKVLLKI